MLEENLQKELIQKGRDFMHFVEPAELSAFESDQDLKRPQPPLVKAPMRRESLALPRAFEGLEMKNDFLALLRARKSSRVYTQQEMSLEQLSFLLWATQGIRDIRGKSYATLRTVPSGGARHGFETYLLIRKVSGLKPGAYHYLPLPHALEYLGEIPELEKTISASLCDQSWASKANAVFYWSAVPYRFEWRYGIYAHRPALIDAGHVGQNLYLACAAVGLGICAIAAYDQAFCDKLFELDGEEEFTIYCAAVGTISAADADNEKAFYHFLEEEGL